MSKQMKRLKNVSLLYQRQNGESSWILLHNGGERDPYFDYYVKHLINDHYMAFNTKKSYCYAVARFVDYLIEVAKFAEEDFGSNECLTGDYLRRVIDKYPKVLACATNTGDDLIQAVCQRQSLKPLKKSSQIVHIAAINRYLDLSESFNVRMRELGASTISGMPIFSDSDLFPQMNNRVEMSIMERIKISIKSMIGGVISGGPKLKSCVTLTPYHVQDNGEVRKDFYEKGKEFPFENAYDFLDRGFASYLYKALFCLLMAIGCRLHEALLLTLQDIDFENQEIYLVSPRLKGVDEYNGYFTIEEKADLPWKGRATSRTLMIEPFASEFWRLLRLYLKNEMIKTNRHPFLFQILNGKNKGSPLILSDHSNLRKIFKKACDRIGIDPLGIHSLRHGFGVYTLNYLPTGPGKFGLPLTTVQYIMGHAKIETTMGYAKPATELLKLAQKANSQILSGFKVRSKKEALREILLEKLSQIQAELENEQD